MKIAYVLYPEVIISNKSNGIRSQAETWGKLLQNHGHTVDFINNWSNYKWGDYDIIHLFGGGKWIYNITNRLYPINQNIVWSPIFDPQLKNGIYLKFYLKRMLQHLSKNKYHWHYYDLVNSIPYIKLFMVRSMFEQDYMIKAFGISKDKISLVPLSYSPTCKPYIPLEKEPFCLHISSIYQERKNVLRLIEAAKKYRFNLVLAGNKGSEEQFKPIQESVGNSTNIKVLGFISEEEKISLYKRAKVFALPSLCEGVGIVALDAAYYGCEIVITNIPGPKEYYNGKCIEVDPYDVDSIGRAIVNFLNGEVFYQTNLTKEVRTSYSPEAIAKQLINTYSNLFQRK